MNRKIYNLVCAALCLALCIVLPFLTGQIPEMGQLLSPMHLPVFICGFVCGWEYGLAVGLIAPPSPFGYLRNAAAFPGSGVNGGRACRLRAYDRRALRKAPEKSRVYLCVSDLRDDRRQSSRRSIQVPSARSGIHQQVHLRNICDLVHHKDDPRDHQPDSDSPAGRYAA